MGEARPVSSQVLMVRHTGLRPISRTSPASLGATEGNRRGARGSLGRTGERLLNHDIIHPACACHCHIQVPLGAAPWGAQRLPSSGGKLLSTKVSHNGQVNLASICIRSQKVPERASLAISFGLIVLFLILCPC